VVWIREQEPRMKRQELGEERVGSWSSKEVGIILLRV